jgi:capsular exopolysaccharide synthesis family protein
MNQVKLRQNETLDYSGKEALNSIATNLTFVGRQMNKFVLTSCAASEGKSSLCLQLMLNLAQRGNSVVMVDADLRASFLMSKLKFDTEGTVNGLVHYLAGYCELDDAIYQTNVEGAYLIPIGDTVANPLPLLDSQDFTQMMEELSKKFDYVIVDAPPIGVVIDAAVVAKSCDGAVFIIEYSKRTKREVAEAVQQLEQSGCPVIGCVINMVTVKSLSDKSYYKKYYYNHYNKYYSHYYGSKTDDTEDIKKKK